MNGSTNSPASRSLVGVTVEAYIKAAQAKERAAKAEAELKTWVKRLNATEVEEYNAQVEAYKAEHPTEK